MIYEIKFFKKDYDIAQLYGDCMVGLWPMHHSVWIRGFHSMKCSNKMLQNLLPLTTYLMYKNILGGKVKCKVLWKDKQTKLNGFSYE